MFGFNSPNIHWRSIIGMRNHIAHGYFELDADIVFEAVNFSKTAILPETISRISPDAASNL